MLTKKIEIGTILNLLIIFFINIYLFIYIMF